jgi:hypothetical protein
VPSTKITQFEDYDPETPWEKQDFESVKAFAAFKVYRDMPGHKRSVKVAILELYGNAKKSTLRVWYGWSTSYKWIWRSSEWDKARDKEERAQTLLDIKFMRERHVKVGQALFQTGLNALKNLQKQLETSPESITALEMLKLIESGYRMERESRGLPEEIDTYIGEEEIVTQDYSGMTTIELRRIIAQHRHQLPAGTEPNVREPDVIIIDPNN